MAREAEERRKAEEAARKAIEQQKAESSAATVSNNNEQTASSVSSNSDLGQQIVDYAVQFVGNPYVYGGTSLTNGADCSGFVMSVYANFGISLPRTSGAQGKSGSSVASLSALMLCVVPYIVPDLVKLFIAAVLSVRLGIYMK